jgi:hypothetical protein
MRSYGVVILLPEERTARSWESDEKSVSLRHSSRGRPMRLWMEAFCCGLPGAM